ncbi:MAG: isochorismatase family protein [Syntrophorhabdaceae bacterium]|nr:isochorismatase family protein [Syntrophorhabdaceae bacterium]
MPKWVGDRESWRCGEVDAADGLLLLCPEAFVEHHGTAGLILTEGPDGKVFGRGALVDQVGNVLETRQTVICRISRQDTPFGPEARNILYRTPPPGLYYRLGRGVLNSYLLRREVLIMSYQGLVDRKDCILVVIDVQDKLMAAMHDKEKVVANTVRLVRFCGICGIPAVFTQQQKLGPTVPEVSSLVDGFTAVEKVHFNCFLNAEFRNEVETTGRKTLLLVGAESHICVAQTAIAAMPDWSVHVVADAVSSRSTENRSIALQRMRDAGAVISSTEMVIYEILVQAGTDEFKAVLPLVK